MEESIAQKETAYLDSTPSGNIITGFDNYMKGTSGAAAQRRKTGPAEQNRVFSRSSISYRPNNGVRLPSLEDYALRCHQPLFCSWKLTGYLFVFRTLRPLDQ